MKNVFYSTFLNIFSHIFYVLTFFKKFFLERFYIYGSILTFGVLHSSIAEHWRRSSCWQCRRSIVKTFSTTSTPVVSEHTSAAYDKLSSYSMLLAKQSLMR